jgi:TrmH family RNA methyltransferase
MLSKNKIKLIRSLEQKKFRTETRLFLAEGNKLVTELLPCFHCELLLATPSWLAANDAPRAGELIEVRQEDIDRISLQKHPQQAIGVFRQAVPALSDTALSDTALALALDGVQDPGNLGTIVRLADWFGIERIVCSPDTADVYNPKTVQATMGAIARVQVHYAPLPDLIRTVASSAFPVYGAFPAGENIYHRQLTPQGLIVMGNEGNGIRPEVEALIAVKLRIPSYPEQRKTSESLNVAVATAIVCAEFRARRAFLN